MLRRTLLHSIRKGLDSPPEVISDDFSIEMRASNKGVEVVIEYLLGDGEQFTADIPNTKDFNEGSRRSDFFIACVINPGEATYHQEDSFWGVEDFLDGIRVWRKRLVEDLRLAPEFRAIDGLRAELEKLDAKFEELPGGYASKEEAAQIVKWIEVLEENLRTQIEKLREDQAVKDSRLAALEAEFASIKDRVPNTKIRPLLRAVIARVGKFSASQQFGQVIENTSGIIGLLGGK